MGPDSFLGGSGPVLGGSGPVLEPARVPEGCARWTNGTRKVGCYLELGYLSVSAIWTGQTANLAEIPILGTTAVAPPAFFTPWAVFSDASGSVEVFGQRFASQIYGEWTLEALGVPFTNWTVFVNCYAGLPRRVPTILGQPGVVDRLVPPRAWRASEQVRFEAGSLVVQNPAGERLVPPQAVFYATNNPFRGVSFELF